MLLYLGCVFVRVLPKKQKKQGVYTYLHRETDRRDVAKDLAHSYGGCEGAKSDIRKLENQEN